jgi:hypothetical protein
MPKYCLYAWVSLCPSPSCTLKMDGFSDAEIRRKTRKTARTEVWRPILCWLFVIFCSTSGWTLRAALTTRHTTNYPERKRNTRDEHVQNFTQHDDWNRGGGLNLEDVHCLQHQALYSIVSVIFITVRRNVSIDFDQVNQFGWLRCKVVLLVWYGWFYHYFTNSIRADSLVVRLLSGSALVNVLTSVTYLSP